MIKEKWCPDCQEFLPIKEFHFNKARHDGVKPYCKLHANERERVRWWKYHERELQRGRNYYEANSEAVLARCKRRYVRTRAKLYTLKMKPCVDCGERFHPSAMDFDHVRGKKKFGITIESALNKPWEDVLEEIEKCELRCAVCHRIRHATEYEFKNVKLWKELYALAGS